MSGGLQYGGMKKYDSQNNVSFNSIVADTISLKNAYNGTFDISGGLNVNENIICLKTIYGYILRVDNYGLFNGNLYVNKDTFLYGNVDISGDLTVHNGDFTIYNNLNIKKGLNLSDKLLLGNNDPDNNVNTYFFQMGLAIWH